MIGLIQELLGFNFFPEYSEQFSWDSFKKNLTKVETESVYAGMRVYVFGSGPEMRLVPEAYYTSGKISGTARRPRYRERFKVFDFDSENSESLAKESIEDEVEARSLLTFHSRLSDLLHENHKLNLVINFPEHFPRFMSDDYIELITGLATKTTPFEDKDLVYEPSVSVGLKVYAPNQR